MLTPKELAGELRVDLFQIYRWVRQRKILVVRPIGNRILIPRMEVERIKLSYREHVLPTNPNPLTPE